MILSQFLSLLAQLSNEPESGMPQLYLRLCEDNISGLLHNFGEFEIASQKDWKR